MAKIKFGSIITDSRGSVGGHTLRMTQYGNILTSKATQRTKETPRETSARTRFATFSQRWWNVLDATQREEWRDLAAANPFTNPWGDEYILNGLAFYIKINCVLVTAGLAPTDDAPADQIVTPLATLSLTATAPDSLILTFTATPVPTDNLLYIFASRTTSPGVTNFDKKLFFIGTLPAATTSPEDIGAAYNARLGPIYPSRQYAVSVHKLNTTNAALSIPLFASAIAT